MAMAFLTLFRLNYIYGLNFSTLWTGYNDHFKKSFDLVAYLIKFIEKIAIND